MGKGGPKESLWNVSLNWMKKNHGKNFDKDKKGTLNILLDHLDGLLGEVASVIEDDFVALDLEAIEEAGIVPLIVPDKLSYLFGSSYILQSEVNEGLQFKIEPSIDGTESFEEEDIEGDIKDDPSYEGEEEEDGDEFMDDPSYEGEEMEDDGTYTCAKCSSTHETYDDLVDHLQKPCFAKNKSTKKIKGRLNRTIEDRTCKTCSKTFTSYGYLKYGHSLVCKGPERNPLKCTFLKCSNCQKEYKTIRNYYFHLKRCSEKAEDQVTDQVNSRNLNEFICLKCGFIASSKDELKNSEHKCEPKKRFMCSKCDFRTFNFTSLRNHDLAIHHKNDPAYCCEICGANFSHRDGFVRHLKTHNEKLPCPHCDKLFSRRSALTRHLNNCHRPPQQHPCESCGKIFSTTMYLKRHIKTQHTEIGLSVKHECTYCHSFFREKGYLRKHIRKKHSNNT